MICCRLRFLPTQTFHNTKSSLLAGGGIQTVGGSCRRVTSAWWQSQPTCNVVPYPQPQRGGHRRQRWSIYWASGVDCGDSQYCVPGSCPTIPDTISPRGLPYTDGSPRPGEDVVTGEEKLLLARDGDVCKQVHLGLLTMCALQSETRW